jgi:hypothetical protein
MNILFILNVLMLIASKGSENILITKGFNFRNLIAAVKVGFRKI